MPTAGYRAPTIKEAPEQCVTKMSAARFDLQDYAFGLVVSVNLVGDLFGLLIAEQDWSSDRVYTRLAHLNVEAEVGEPG